MSKIKLWMQKKKHFLFAAAAIAVLTAGMSLAFFTDAETAANTMKTGSVQIEIEEEVDGLKKMDISVTGTGKSPCYVRMRVDVPVLNYQEGAEKKILSPKVYYNTPDDEEETVPGETWNVYGERKEIGTGTGSSTEVKAARWVKKADGYWYLSSVLPADATAVLCNTVEYEDLLHNGELELPTGISKDQLSIVVYAEAVQADNIDVSGQKGADAAYAAFQQLKVEKQ